MYYNISTQERHACLFYKSHQERNQVMTQFIVDGIHSNEQILCVIDPKDVSLIRKSIRELSIHKKSYKEDRLLNFHSPSDVYFSNNQFDKTKAMEFWGRYLTPTLKTDGMRLIGDLSHALNSLQNRRSLMEYEVQFHAMYTNNEYYRKNKIQALCMYNWEKNNHHSTLELLDSHTSVIFNNYEIPLLDKHGSWKTILGNLKRVFCMEYGN